MVRCGAMRVRTIHKIIDTRLLLLLLFSSVLALLLWIAPLSLPFSLGHALPLPSFLSVLVFVAIEAEVLLVIRYRAATGVRNHGN